MAFRVGQKVVCVDADGAAMLTKDMIYTIKAIDPLAVRKWRLQIMEIASLQLYEVSPEFNFVGFAPQRFRPAVDRKFDISVFTRMLRCKSKVEV